MKSGTRPIITGGTGLYFRALTEGLVEIPQIPKGLRYEADQMPLATLLSGLDRKTKSRIDQRNRARVQRAWEVQKTTGRSLSDWQDRTPPPMLPVERTIPILVEAPKDWLNPRIEKRFEMMLEQGALEEARAMQADWNPNRASSKAIGAAELIAHLNGELTLEEATEQAILATRQYAKRQRTWFRARMGSWHKIPGSAL